MSTNRSHSFSVLAVLLSAWVAGCADNATEPAQGSTARPQFSDARASRGGSRLLASWRGSIVGSTPVPYSTLPAGVTWCLAMRNSPMVGVTSGMTLPGAIQNSEVIGCDSVLAPGGTYVIDYDASNSPGFAQVAARLTNNVADPVWFGGAHADRSLHVLTISAGPGTREHDLTDARVNGGTATGGFTGSDFAGFALDFVRLRVSDVQMSLSTTTAGSVAPSPPIAFVSDRDGNSDIYVMNANGTGPVNLTNNPGFDVDPSWSPDGSKIAFHSFRDADGNDELYIMNADGTGLVRVTNDLASGPYDAQPNWSPDGSRLAFVSDRGGNSEHY